MILLDFDGVLMDSVPEVAVSAYNACMDGLLTDVSALPEGLLETFRSCRHFMREPSEAIPLMTWCLDSLAHPSGPSLDAATFRRCCRSSPLPPDVRRQRLFAARKRLWRAAPGAFLSLNRPFQPLWDFLAHGRRRPFVVLTTKNRQAVLSLCRHFGLDIDAGDVYAGDGGSGKSTNMLSIHRRFAAPQYVFIDDLLPNLRQLRDGFRQPGVRLRLFLAQWGYGPDTDAEIAPQEGIAVIDPQGAIDLLLP